MRIVSLVFPVLMVLSPAVWCATMICDFESDAALKPWTIRTVKQDKIRRVDGFAPSGNFSGELYSPPWKKGMQEWPAFELKPDPQDWTPYDRLSLVVANPMDYTQSLQLYITDSDTKLQEGYSHTFTLQPRSWEEVVIDLSRFPDQIARNDIQRVHFYTTRPSEKLLFWLDRIVLLAPGEEGPDWPGAFPKQVLSLIMPEKELAETGKMLDGAMDTEFLSDALPVFSGYAMKFVGKMVTDFAEIKTRLESSEPDLEAIADSAKRLKQLPLTLDRLQRIRELMDEASDQRGSLILHASSMVKALPRDVALPENISTTDTVSVQAARKETESFQIIVLPLGKKLRKVSVTVPELRGPGGAVLPEDAVECAVTGYVKTGQPPYLAPYQGWWPDPILDFMHETDIERGDAQSFWVRITVPADQAAGEYQGTIRIAGDNLKPVEKPLRLQVFDFSMPEASPLPTAISVHDKYIQKFTGNSAEAKFIWADFLADYYIDWDSLYRSGPPDYDILKRLEAQGRLVTFNLGYFSAGKFKADMSDADFEKAMDSVLAQLRKSYNGAKAAGLLDKAYIYGFDECNQDLFPMLERICKRLKLEFPEVPLLTTTRDNTYGRASKVVSMDGWTPLTPHYHPAPVEKAREKGIAVWWYICCSPKHPHANWFVEYPAIDTRLLMGAMTAKFRPDGFLYYAITRWPVNNAVISSGPFTDWDPASFRTFNGDGSIVCPGPEGLPLATIRLENYRDGLEDYAYARILEAMIARVRASDGKTHKVWLKSAEASLRVPEKVVESLTEFTGDPDAVYQWRNGLAAAIESAPVEPADPESIVVRTWQRR